MRFGLRVTNVTVAPKARAGAGGWNSGSTRTVPVKYSAGPLPEGCEPRFDFHGFTLLLVSEDQRPVICSSFSG
jgi:hypothetical protein